LPAFHIGNRHMEKPGYPWESPQNHLFCGATTHLVR
jgi:hypothetical protein